MESMADPSALEGVEDDPRAMGQMMRKMGKEMGEEMPPEFDDVVDVSRRVNRLKRSNPPS